MNRGGNDNANLDKEESSGVTRLAPVPVKTIRLCGLDENDRTQYFSVSNLQERGKAVAARLAQNEARIAAPSAEPPRLEPPQSVPKRRGVVQQFREASFARQAAAVVLPLAALLLLLEPVFEPPKRAAEPARAGAPSAAVAASLPPPALAQQPPAIKLAATPAEPPPTLPRGVSLERAATDAVASGDFKRASALYRELTRRNPNNVAYREALHILELRLRTQTP